MILLSDQGECIFDITYRWLNFSLDLNLRMICYKLETFNNVNFLAKKIKLELEILQVKSHPFCAYWVLEMAF